MCKKVAVQAWQRRARKLDPAPDASAEDALERVTHELQAKEEEPQQCTHAGSVHEVPLSEPVITTSQVQYSVATFIRTCPSSYLSSSSNPSPSSSSSFSSSSWSSSSSFDLHPSLHLPHLHSTDLHLAHVLTLMPRLCSRTRPLASFRPALPLGPAADRTGQGLSPRTRS